MAPDPDLVTLGECLVALVGAEGRPLRDPGAFLPHPVGAELNVAVAVARLGRRAAFVGRIGDDGLGEFLVRCLRAEDLDLSALRSDPAAPTAVLIRARPGLGPAQVAYHRRGSAGSRLAPEDVDAASHLFRGAGWLHVSGITPALSGSAAAAVERAVATARSHGVRISFDVNYRQKLWSAAAAREALAPLVPRADVVFASEAEAALLSGLPEPDAAAALLKMGAGRVVLKLGAAGARSIDEQGGTAAVGALGIPLARDFVGAGDALAGGYLAARMAAEPEQRALETGAACAAAVIAAEGDVAGLPTRAELARILAGSGDDAIR